MFKNNLMAALAVGVTLCMNSANAAIVSFDFEAEFFSSHALPVAPIAGSMTEAALAASTISGSITFDTTALDTDPAAQDATYATGRISINEFAVPSINAATTSTKIQNNTPFFGASLDTLDTTIFTATTDEYVRIILQSNDPSLFPNADLPTMVPDLSKLNNAREINIGSLTTRHNVKFWLTSFTMTPDPSPVPLPAGLPMLLAALGGLACVRARRGV